MQAIATQLAVAVPVIEMILGTISAILLILNKFHLAK